MKTTYRILSLFCLFILSACAAAPTAVPTAAPASPTAAPVSTSAASQPAAATQPAGVKVFTIVPGESSVTYEVAETFLNQNNKFNLAVGVTNTIQGEINADPANPASASIGKISVDISQFKSDSSRRDNAIRGQWLESSRFPTATFEPTRIEGLPQRYVEGQEYPLKVTGNLTIRDSTHEVTFDVVTSLKDGTLTGTATTSLQMSTFGVGPISIAGILNTEDQVKLTFKFVAR